MLGSTVLQVACAGRPECIAGFAKRKSFPRRTAREVHPMHYFRPHAECFVPAGLSEPTSLALPGAFRSMRELTPRVLDRLADAELQHGHHGRAEALARLAAELRDGVR
jgi:hypothetical protein